MNLGEVGMFLAIGFVPTLIALEMVYRMDIFVGDTGHEMVPIIRRDSIEI